MKKKLLIALCAFIFAGSLFSCSHGNKGDYGDQNNNNPPSGETTEDKIFTEEGRKIEYVVSYTIESNSINDVKNLINSEIFKLNGYISASEENVNSYSYITYKAPSSCLQNVISYIDSQGDIIKNKVITSKDVTTTYNKVQSDITTLEASKKAYENILTNNTLNYDDIIKINDKILEIDKQLANLYNQLDSISESTDYAEINIRYYQTNEKEDNPFQDYLSYFTEFGKVILNYVVYTIPFVLLSGIIILITYLIWKKKKSIS